MRYTISRTKLLGIGLALLSNFFHVGELHAASTISTYEYAELNNCVIPAGSSTCIATLAVYAPSGLTFTVNNLTRGITSTNILTPNNYILYAGGYAYVLKDTFLNDAANRLTYGDNDLIIIKSGTDLPSMKAVGNASCATGTTWNGQTCGSSVPPIFTGSTTSTVIIKTGNGDTSYNFSLPKDISKNYYIPEQVTKDISIPNTTSVLNIELASTKERCSISPTYTTDSGLSFSSNGKDFLKPDTKSVSHMVPTYAGLITPAISNVLYGRLSAISISCDNVNALVKDFIILKITYGSTLPPIQPTEIQATNCTIASGKSTCISTVSMSPAPSKNYDLENSSRGLTMTNAFRQGVSKISTSILGEQAANYLTFGSNTLNLKDGSTIVSSVQATAICASGTTWNGQICEKPAPLSISCSKSSYTVGEEVSCIIKGGGIGAKTCWQTGTKATTAVDCRQVGWVEDGNLYYYSTVTAAMAGKYTLYTKDAAGQTASTTVEYIGENSYYDFITENCTIAAGKSTCVSTFYLVNPVSGKSYDVKNVTRNLTTRNFFTPNSLGTLPGSNYPTYKVSSAPTTFYANVATFGTSSLVLIDSNGINLKKSTFVASCAIGSTWNGKICVAKLPPIACTMEARMCDDGSMMPRDPLTCEWLPGQCTPVTPATSIILNDFIINDTVFDYTGGTISLTTNDILSLKGGSRPGAPIYFYREGQSTYDSVKTGVNGDWSFGNIWSPAGAKIIIPGTYTYILAGLPPDSQSTFYSPQVGIRIKVSASSTTKPTINFLNRSPKVLSSGQTMYMSWGTSNATSFSYFCKGNGPMANKKVSMDLNKATYGGTWSALIAEGWNGVYECDFTAIGSGGTTSLTDSFAILPAGSAANPGSTYTDFQANNCTIPVGKSTCASTLYITTQEGKSFSVKNATRGLTTSNLLTLNNYKFIAGMNSPVYTVSTNTSGDAANYAIFGINDFVLYDGASSTTGVAKAVMTATCATGSSWNGQICAELPPSGQSGGISTPSNTTVKMTNCVIPQGKSTCPSTVLVFAQSGKTFSVYNVERDVNSQDILKPKDFRSISGKKVYILRGTSLKLASNLTYGSNTLYVTEKGLENYPITVTGTAKCSIGRKWDGTKCISAIPTVFSITGFTTARGEKVQSGGSIVFNPSLDKTLTLQGVGPYGVIEVRESGSTTSLIRSSSSDSTGKWKIMINTSLLVSKGVTSLIVWDGKNTSSQVQIQIYNETFSDPIGTSNGTTISASSTPLKTTLVDYSY